MEKLQWDESLSVGIELIDQQHRMLIKRLDDFAAAVEASHGTMQLVKTLTYLIEYTEFHFDAEAIHKLMVNAKGAQYDYVIGPRLGRTSSKEQYAFVFDATRIEYAGRFGVFDLMAEFGLTRDEALDVSDRLPVWAEFSARESGVAGPMASRPGMPVR